LHAAPPSNELWSIAMTVTLEVARQILAAQPFSVLLGTRLAAFGDGGATLELDIRHDLLQQFGFLHGGVLSYAADNAITYAAATALGPELVTAGFTMSYLRPAGGVLLRAEATVVQAGSRNAVCTCELRTYDETGAETLCAIAQGTAISRR